MRMCVRVYACGSVCMHMRMDARVSYTVCMHACVSRWCVHTMHTPVRADELDSYRALSRPKARMVAVDPTPDEARPVAAATGRVGGSR